MDDQVLVKAENVSKKFCHSLKKSLWYGVQDIAAELTGHKYEHELRPDEFWAVNDVSFELKRGECLGLIGPNGSGKSTLLKILNGLIKPDKGRVTIKGRVGALIELGTGFNPILTGLENIYNNAAVLGISKAEVDKKLDEIIEFAEIGDFIKMPVQNYSSGMKVRLGFAVAAQMEPDVLIIDEVLAVGDVGFRSKCYNAISRLAESTAIIFVSHFMPQVSRLSTQALLLKHGKTHFFGSTNLAIIEYYKLFDVKGSGVRTGSGEAHIKQIKFLNKNGLCKQVECGEPLHIVLEIEAKVDVESLVVDICFLTIADDFVAECNNFVYPYKISMMQSQSLTVVIEINEFTLNPGVYKVSALLHSSNMTAHYDWMQCFTTIEVLGRVASAGQQFKANWKILTGV